MDVVIYPTFSGAQGYLNVVSDLYPDPGTRRDKWIVKNFPFPLHDAPGFLRLHSPGKVSMAFKLAPDLPLPRGSFDVFASFTLDPIDMPDTAKMTPSLALTFTPYDTEYLRTEGAEGTGGGRAGLHLVRAEESAEFASLLHYFAMPPRTTDIVDDVPAGVRTDIPGIKQGKDECAPTATAQSLEWLANNKKITLPKQFQETQNEKGRRALIDALKQFMGWEPNHGVNPENFTSGKKAFIAKYKLPLEVEQGGKENGDGTFDFIKAQIAKGQDVELWLMFDNMGGKHVVTVAGTHEDKGKKYIYLQDPISPGTNPDSYELTGKGDKAGKVLDNYKYHEGVTKMMFAVAESPQKKE